MNSKQLSAVLGVLVGLVCLAIVGVAYEINVPLRNKTSELSGLKVQYTQLDAQQNQNYKNLQDLKTYEDLGTIARSVVPQDKNADIVTLQITNLAQQSGVGTLTSITLPSSNLGGTGTGTAGNPALSQLTVVKGLSGVYDLPITVAQQNPVSYAAFQNFLGKLQQNRRTANISSISVQPKESGYAFTLIIDEYIKP